MNTRRTAYLLIAAVVSVLVLAPWRGAAMPPRPPWTRSPSKGAIPGRALRGNPPGEGRHRGRRGQLLLTGVLDGTATQLRRAQTRVRGQPFTAPAVPVEAERTTDVVLLKMAPIALASVGRPLTLARCPSTSRPSPMRASCPRCS